MIRYDRELPILVRSNRLLTYMVTETYLVCPVVFSLPLPSILSLILSKRHKAIHVL